MCQATLKRLSNRFESCQAQKVASLLTEALRFLDPKTDDEAEKDLVRAMANARTSVGDGLETIRARLGKPG
jgi:LPS O-antigen subunit length determinant protein (WzzB/FepE family)